jgi:hypothetical protein
VLPVIISRKDISSTVSNKNHSIRLLLAGIDGQEHLHEPFAEAHHYLSFQIEE